MKNEERFDLTQNFINRELSWLEFNQRVFEGALDPEIPLFERLKFLSIVSSNLDEFFQVRVAVLHDQGEAGIDKRDISGLLPEENLTLISVRAHLMVDKQYDCYRRTILKALKSEKLHLLKLADLKKHHLKFIDHYYLHTIYPVLTPHVVDQGRPFPLIQNKSLNIALLIKSKNGNLFATVQVPSVLSRVVEIPTGAKDRELILLEDIIFLKLEHLFQGHELITAGFFRITRNADVNIDEEGAEDLLETIEQSMRQRRWGSAIRLEVVKGFNPELLSILQDELELSVEDIYENQGPVDLTFLMQLSELKSDAHLFYPPVKPQCVPAFSEEEDIFKAIAKNDILLHHPYQSFDPVIKLVRASAVDPQVLAIKQTLYRVSGKSPIIEALALAAENGKQVTVLVELKARFDEEKNILWAKRLEKAGCHVVYGLVGLKTHCKVLLIVRREENGIKRYVHLSTGNYNDVTARIYTDLGLFTSKPKFGADASALFNLLTGLSLPTDLYRFSIAPLGMRDKFRQLIEEETTNARNGKKARIIVKVNSLIDKDIILALYHASSAGVKIDLIVRGVCSLRPGIPGVSENITVRSIVGRFLEHHRIFYFYHNGEEMTFLSSADWMPRNLDRRVELLFPLENREIKQEVKNILYTALADTLKARLLTPSGTYKKIDKRRKKLVDSQKLLYELAVAQAPGKPSHDREEPELDFQSKSATLEVVE